MSDEQDIYNVGNQAERERPGYFAKRKMQKQLNIKMKKEKRQKPLREKRKKLERKSSVWGALSSLITVFLVIVLLVAGTWLGVTQTFDVKNNQTDQVLFKVASGDNLNVISDRLESQKLISNSTIYAWLVSLEGNDTRLKAGEYNIPGNASMRDIMNIFVGGQSIQHKLTFAEGLTTAQILDRIKEAPLLTGQITSAPAEGSLMPETYLFASGTSREEIIKQMMDAQNKFVANLWDTRAEGLPLESMEEVMILASIVEKETGVSSERAEVAAVFINRLNKKMRLQSDPTIIYGITLGKYKLGRQLKKSEIKANTPYNTYTIDRLPPTPIANPGRAAILAVLNPADNDYIFFVADGTGGHAFAKTLKEHNNNVKKLRAREKAAK